MDLSKFDSFTNSWWPIGISFVISLIAGIRLYMGGPKCPSANRIDDKVVLITGASNGLGLATAKELAARGGKIILTCRNEEKGRRAIEDIQLSVPNADIDLKLLDVSRMQGIRDFVSQIVEEYEKIDILINNAGIMFQEYEQTEEKLELTFATNYLGPFLLTHLLLPLLSKSENGRVINITALAHYQAKMNVDNLNFCKEFMYREAFGQTKLALVMFTKYLGTLLKGTNITINAVNPGIVRNTNHFKNSPLGNSWMTKVSTFPWTWLFLKTPKQGSQTIIYAAVDPMIQNITGAYLSDCEEKEPSELTKDELLMEKLYVKSCELSKISSEKLLKKIL